MGHLLSKRARSLSRHRRCRRGRKVPPRSRGCFLRGPCMLCFVVHSASPPVPEQALPAADSPLPPPPYAVLASAEQRVARRLLCLPPAAWEPRPRCPRLLLSGLLPSPVRGFLGPPGELASEMLCKRKGAGLPACPPCKQPRCAAAAEPEAVACQCPGQPQLCALPAAGGCAAGGAGAPARGPAGESGGGQHGSPPSPAPEERGGEAGCEEPLERPGDCCLEPLPPPAPNINQLPSSILLKILSNLSMNERCLSASLVCKYWRDLCLDFQFWKQLDLSSRQQVTDELLEKLASRSQNITEINISDCRNVSDTGVCILAIKCPGLLRYTAYRCKQLSDTSIIAVASQCPHLQKVHVGNQDRLTDESLKQLGSKCRELKDIHFGQCYKISDEGMIIIAKGCLKLQRIYMQENKLQLPQHLLSREQSQEILELLLEKAESDEGQESSSLRVMDGQSFLDAGHGWKRREEEAGRKLSSVISDLPLSLHRYMEWNISGQFCCLSNSASYREVIDLPVVSDVTLKMQQLQKHSTVISLSWNTLLVKRRLTEGENWLNPDSNQDTLEPLCGFHTFL
ncbi:F-box/LRR-repeat protein 17 isoform X3 [Apus apus]|uniref:F-box/LRR-repeat protein 17 isoform X3 n=1 Tax=Apus apus TaxID=8895 RepID=UPI0021F8E7EB|nr:F-box/LRR-repeat protein 17 isoform X3 [Apus apus]